MKHNTHIFIATKAIEYLYDGLSNLCDKNGNKITGSTKNKLRKRGRILQRLLKFHQERVVEASWAPDDILKDMKQYHTFKLFTKKMFTDADSFGTTTTIDRNNKTYYRAKGSGGLAYKIDHLAKIIKDIIKLRMYNDNYSMEHIMYLFLLLSHYVTDAHVPMHCDIRDDIPSATKPQNGNYYEQYGWHAKLEGDWDNAVNYIIENEGIYGADNKLKNVPKTNLVDYVNPDLNDIYTHAFDRDELMDHAVDICVKSHERSVSLFPINDPSAISNNLDQITYDIFCDSIGDLISIWVCMWPDE